MKESAISDQLSKAEIRFGRWREERETEEEREREEGTVTCVEERRKKREKRSSVGEREGRRFLEAINKITQPLS